MMRNHRGQSLTLCGLVLALVACNGPGKPASYKLAQPQQQLDSRLRRIADVPSGPNKYIIHCVSTSVCWVGDFLKQWRTDDGGQHWQLVYVGTPFDGEINTVEYVDEQLAWMLTLKKLLKTEDGGKTWVEQPPPLPAYLIGELRSIKFLKGGKIGWAGGGVYRPVTKSEEQVGVPSNLFDPQSHRVLKPMVAYTADGGKSWIPQSIPNNAGRISGLTFLNERQGFAFDSSGPLYTTDGGNQWKYVDFKKSCTDEKYLEGYDMRPLEVSFLDSRNAWLTFEDGRIAKSTDGGQTWCDLLAPDAVKFDYYEKYFRTIHFCDSLHGLGLGANRLLYETTDGGKTWNKAMDRKADDMFFLDNRTGWLVSKEGLFQIGP
jgi:photosystem II stability/assembly factor-like uncharacterized protein